MTDIDGFVLGVDLGTSHTVAMLRHPDGRTRPLLFDGQPLLPSAVFLDASGRLHVGVDALRLGHAEPGRVEPNPKRHVDDGSVLLGDGASIPVADLFAALLVVGEQKVMARLGQEPLGRARQRRRIEKIGRPMDLGGVHDPLDAHGDHLRACSEPQRRRTTVVAGS